jgi:hypothetical protein
VSTQAWCHDWDHVKYDASDICGFIAPADQNRARPVFEMGIPLSESQFVAFDHTTTTPFHRHSILVRGREKPLPKNQSRWIRLW